MDTLVKQVAQYVEKMFHEYFHPNFFYHNIEHTRNVVSRVNEISQYYQLSDKDHQLVTIAAWFHDVAYLISEPYEHERKSVSAMKFFLLCSSIGETAINIIAGCIMSTKLPSNPDSFLQKILCDADTYHLGTEDFWQSDIEVKRETEAITQSSIHDWDRKTLLFLQDHQYFTGYCKDLLTQGKLDNIMRLSKKVPPI